MIHQLSPQLPVETRAVCLTVTMGGEGFVLNEAQAEFYLRDPKNASVVLQITGGEEVNGPPSLMNTRYAINFGTRTLEEAEHWPELLEIVRTHVLPQRLKAKDHGPGNHGKKYWWQHTLRADPLYAAIREMDTCLVMAQVSAHHAIMRESRRRLFNKKVFVFAFDAFAAFAVLQSRLHEFWSAKFSSRLGLSTTNYSVSKTFMTYPFPIGFEQNKELESIGAAYHEFRSEWMSTHDEGLTVTYNRFHNPHETSSEISRLRELHAVMDRAVLEAYGWHDLARSATSEFLLDDEDDENEDEGSGARSPGTGRQKKKPWRYRWPDPFRDEVLARLLELNKQRHQEELLVGQASQVAITSAAEGPKKKTTRKKKSAPSSTDQSELDFDEA